MTASPELEIRRYLEERGGKAEATVDHLLISFEIADTDQRGRISIVTALRAAGVDVDRPLEGLQREESVSLSLSRSESSPSVPPWSRPGTAMPLSAGSHRRRGPWLVASTAGAVVAACAAAAVGYELGKRSGVDLDPARAEGTTEGRREVATTANPRAITSARRAGRRAGYRRAYQLAFGKAQKGVIAAAPQACGDVRTSKTPSLVNVRALGVSCEAARSFVSTALDCGGLEGGCNGYSCEPVSIGWESSEFTCTSGEAEIRFITGV